MRRLHREDRMVRASERFHAHFDRAIPQGGDQWSLNQDENAGRFTAMPAEKRPEPRQKSELLF